MVKYKNIELDAELGEFIRHMNAVEEYREILQNLQAVWDNLTLLGQLSGTGTDMSGTRHAFHQLTGNLLNHLGKETLDKCVQEMAAKAQVSIDILVRNLFERTADIGFLSTDEDLRHFIGHAVAASGNIHGERELKPLRDAIRKRFAEYVAKYSVYSDIVLLDPQGHILLRLDDTIAVRESRDTLIAESLNTAAAYVESFRHIDFLPNEKHSLVYSYRVTGADGEPIGVLCLSFRFANEMERIFGNLVTPDDWSVVVLLDSDSRVIASSDAFHIPLGAILQRAEGDYKCIRFGGREYLATTRTTHGYQGYQGPGWVGHTMLPVQHAFNKDASERLRKVSAELRGNVMRNPALFGEALRSIPAQAERIQRDLNLSVWNGNVRQSGAKRALNPAFSKILLWEISNTGTRTKDVFERSITNLHETVVSAILQDSEFLASLAIDIMDRNLYERANDCRWWALTSAFRSGLAENAAAESVTSKVGEILQTINGLYTVYSNLLVFDVQGRVLAVSQQTEQSLVGRPLTDPWVANTLALVNAQGYTVSQFAPSPLYGNRPTYIYCAAIRAPESEEDAPAGVVGGVAIVFDSAPQFAAMLNDALPKTEAGDVVSGCFGVFSDRSGRIIASTDPRWSPGDRLPKMPQIEAALGLPTGGSSADIVEIDHQYYAIGTRISSGYREFKSDSDNYRNDVAALIFVSLCSVSEKSDTSEIPRLNLRSDRSSEGETVEIATFLIGSSWFGLRTNSVVEALDSEGMTRVPGAGNSFGGYLMYEGSPIPAYDIRDLANAGPALPITKPQVIVLRRSTTGSNGLASLFGILADALGEIPEVAGSRLRPLPNMLAGGNVLADAIVSTETPESEHLLIVLGADRIAGRVMAANGGAFINAAPLQVTGPQNIVHALA